MTTETGAAPTQNGKCSLIRQVLLLGAVASLVGGFVTMRFHDIGRFDLVTSANAAAISQLRQDDDRQQQATEQIRRDVKDQLVDMKGELKELRSEVRAVTTAIAALSTRLDRNPMPRKPVSP